MKKKGQRVRLKNTKTEDFITVKVILADSKQGYLAEEINKPDVGFLDAWQWYNLNEWEEIR